nr:glycosyltransferase family 4 protein [Sphingomonas jinjuensis]
MLPIIPLGVDTARFAIDDDRRAAARSRLAIGDDETVFLFAGRLSFHGKAHPFEMLRGLDMAAQLTGQPVTLLLAGQFFNDAIADAYRSALAQFAPHVRPIIVDGADDTAYGDGWAAADAFVSLSDNIQETFGITPIEAMAAGLPVVVSDWDGYRDTVRDGVDGFRVPTWAPQPGSGFDVAARYEAEASTFDQQASQTSTAVSVDMAVLVDRLAALIRDPDLRRRLGTSGRERARADYDWAVVYAQYRALWAEQAAVRDRLSRDAATADRLSQAPRETAPFRDPTASFASYPTHHVKPATRVTLVDGASVELFEALTAHVSLNRWNPPADVTGAWIGALRGGPRTVADLALATRQEPAMTVDGIARLAKLGIVRLG